MRYVFFTSLLLIFLGGLVSCESTNSLRAGGGAFDDSELGRKLDANSHLDDPEIPGSRSFEQWREQDRTTSF